MKGSERILSMFTDAVKSSLPILCFKNIGLFHLKIKEE